MNTKFLISPICKVIVSFLLALGIFTSAIGTDNFPIAQAYNEIKSDSDSHLLMPEQSVNHSGTISSDETWQNADNVHIITGDVTVAIGVTLTIEPGAIIKFNSGKSLIVNGTLLAQGTSVNPVYFTSYRDDSVGGDTNGDGVSSGARGDWYRIEFTSYSSPASLVDYAVIRYGGHDDYYHTSDWGAIALASASPTIQNSVITENNYAGISAISSSPVLGCNNILDNDYGIRNNTPDPPYAIDAENQWWGNASGPYHSTSNPSGAGNAVSGGVDFIPFRTSACGTVIAPPSAFNKSSPANGATNQSTSPTLTWGSSSGATSYEYCYDTTNDNACSAWTSNGTSTSKPLSGLSAGTTYYWHVRAVNSGGTTYANGSSTSFWSFRTASNPPGAFNKSSPTNNATNQPTSLILTWGSSSGAISYDFCYDTTNDNNCSSWINNGTSTSKVLSGLSIDTTYYWQVRANNIGGTIYANNNTWWSFTTQSFSDVSHAYWAWQFIVRLYNAGITSGCTTNPLNYCPEYSVTRAQMSVFLEKGMHYPSSYNAPNVAPTFTDTVGHWAEDWIEALKNDGITSGCGTGLYCPEAPVTRAQMAVFLLRAKYGSSYSPPTVGASTGFGDIPTNYWAAAWIKQLVAEGITSGCGSGNYCPETPVTRAQMAVFLVKTFNLP